SRTSPEALRTFEGQTKRTHAYAVRAAGPGVHTPAATLGPRTVPGHDRLIRRSRAAERSPRRFLNTEAISSRPAFCRIVGRERRLGQTGRVLLTTTTRPC